MMQNSHLQLIFQKNEAIRVGINVRSSISTSNSTAPIAKHIQFMSKVEMLNNQSINIVSMAK
jgi:hypothetical protein